MTPTDTAINPHKASAGISLAESADPRRVLADRVEQIYSQMPIGIAGSFVISVVAAYELRQGRFVENVAFLAGLGGLLTPAGIRLYWGQRPQPTQGSQDAQWAR